MTTVICDLQTFRVNNRGPYTVTTESRVSYNRGDLHLFGIIFQSRQNKRCTDFLWSDLVSMLVKPSTPKSSSSHLMDNGDSLFKRYRHYIFSSFLQNVNLTHSVFRHRISQNRTDQVYIFSLHSKQNVGRRVPAARL